jgi:hypothetical protein
VKCKPTGAPNDLTRASAKRIAAVPKNSGVIEKMTPKA